MMKRYFFGALAVALSACGGGGDATPAAPNVGTTSSTAGAVPNAATEPTTGTSVAATVNASLATVSTGGSPAASVGEPSPGTMTPVTDGGSSAPDPAGLTDPSPLATLTQAVVASGGAIEGLTLPADASGAMLEAIAGDYTAVVHANCGGYAASDEQTKIPTTSPGPAKFHINPSAQCEYQGIFAQASIDASAESGAGAGQKGAIISLEVVARASVSNASAFADGNFAAPPVSTLWKLTNPTQSSIVVGVITTAKVSGSAKMTGFIVENTSVLYTSSATVDTVMLCMPAGTSVFIGLNGAARLSLDATTGFFNQKLDGASSSTGSMNLFNIIKPGWTCDSLGVFKTSALLGR